MAHKRRGRKARQERIRRAKIRQLVRAARDMVQVRYFDYLYDDISAGRLVAWADGSFINKLIDEVTA